MKVWDCYLFLMNWLLYHYEMTFVIPGNILCSEIYIASCLLSYSSFLWLVLVWCIILYPLTFNLIVSLYLKHISCSQRVDELYFLFLIQSNIYLLIGVLRPFAFYVTLDTVRFESTTFCNLSHLIFAPLSLFSAGFWVNWIFSFLFYLVYWLITVTVIFGVYWFL